MKILDLGCGTTPGFALAAKALGAEVHTADHQDLDPGVRAMLDSHTIVDLTDPTASETLRRATGDDFRLVTENIIGAVPENLALPVPTADIVQGIGEALLRRGGVLHVAPGDLFIKL